MTDFTEQELRRRFADLRTADRASAPSYDATIRRRHSRSVVAPRVYPVFAVAATAMLAFGLCLKGGSSQATVTPQIAEWQPASDVLLSTARPPLFGPMPPLGASVLDTLLR